MTEQWGCLWPTRHYVTLLSARGVLISPRPHDSDPLSAHPHETTRAPLARISNVARPESARAAKTGARGPPRDAAISMPGRHRHTCHAARATVGTRSPHRLCAQQREASSARDIIIDARATMTLRKRRRATPQSARMNTMYSGGRDARRPCCTRANSQRRGLIT